MSHCCLEAAVALGFDDVVVVVGVGFDR